MPIVELGDDYIVHRVYDESDNKRYTITPDTLIGYEIRFRPGDGCQLIVNNEGVVLSMIQSNG